MFFLGFLSKSKQCPLVVWAAEGPGKRVFWFYITTWKISEDLGDFGEKHVKVFHVLPSEKPGDRGSGVTRCVVFVDDHIITLVPQWLTDLNLFWCLVSLLKMTNPKRLTFFW